MSYYPGFRDTHRPSSSSKDGRRRRNFFPDFADSLMFDPFTFGVEDSHDLLEEHNPFLKHRQLQHHQQHQQQQQQQEQEAIEERRQEIQRNQREAAIRRHLALQQQQEAAYRKKQREYQQEHEAALRRQQHQQQVHQQHHQSHRSKQQQRQLQQQPTATAASIHSREGHSMPAHAPKHQQYPEYPPWQQREQQHQQHGDSKQHNVHPVSQKISHGNPHVNSQTNSHVNTDKVNKRDGRRGRVAKGHGSAVDDGAQGDGARTGHTARAIETQSAASKLHQQHQQLQHQQLQHQQLQHQQLQQQQQQQHQQQQPPRRRHVPVHLKKDYFGSRDPLNDMSSLLEATPCDDGPSHQKPQQGHPRQVQHHDWQVQRPGTFVDENMGDEEEDEEMARVYRSIGENEKEVDDEEEEKEEDEEEEEDKEDEEMSNLEDETTEPDKEQIEKRHGELEAIGKQLDDLQTELEQILAGQCQKKKQILMTEEMITKAMIKVDSIESSGDVSIRQRRKGLITRCESLLEQVDGYKRQHREELRM
ncbi:hypothetical protein BGZ94_001904 [Podila epigama]|nr:hypothetical protein BGZ94_001904 [Podila epigama]